MRTLALCVVLLGGCMTAEPLVLVGEGLETFREIEVGGSVELLAGPQGGYHVLLGVRCDGCDSPVTVTYGIRDARSSEPLTFDDLERIVVLRQVDEWAEYTPLIAFMRETDPAMYADRDVEVWATVRDDRDATGEASVFTKIVYDAAAD